MRLDDGAETTVERWGETGPLIVCVHGMTSSRLSWERTALHLSDRYRVVAYDQRGHGDSAAVTGPMSIERSVRDLENVIAELGEIPYALLGHSWGGAVVIETGRRVAVDRVVALDPALRQLSDAWYDEFLEELAPLFALQGEARAARVREEFAAWPEIDRERKVHAVATMTAEPIRRLRDDNPGDAWDLRATVVGYPKPLLIAAAAPENSILDAGDLELLRERGGPLVEVAVFPGSDHNLHRTAFGPVTAALERFLA